MTRKKRRRCGFYALIVNSCENVGVGRGGQRCLESMLLLDLLGKSIEMSKFVLCFLLFIK